MREALRQLEHEGLVVSYPYRGAVVLGVSDEEVHQVLIPIRLTLERFSFTKALERMDGARLRRARQGGLADGARRRATATCSAASRPTSASTSSCSRAPASRTRPRSGAASRRGSAPTSSATASHSDLGRIAVEHGQLLAALRSGDPTPCWTALERHITVRTPGAR